MYTSLDIIHACYLEVRRIGLFVTMSLTMLSKLAYVLSFSIVLITVIHSSLLAPEIGYVNFKTVPSTCRTAESDHMSLIPPTLHWLPVESRIQYKIIILGFK